MVTSKTCVSIAQMRRELEINACKTIWVMAHKILKAMADRDVHYTLAGLVQIDEFFFGPPAHGKRGGGAEKKETAIVAVSAWKDESGQERPGFAHAFLVENASVDTINSILKRLKDPEDESLPPINKILSDGSKSHIAFARGLGIAHHRAILRDPIDSMKFLPWTRRLIVHAKAVLYGPHHGVSSKDLQRYLAEVCCRFDRRYWYRQASHRLLRASATTEIISGSELIA